MNEDKGAQVFTNRTNKCFSNLRVAKSYWNQILPYISKVKFENLWLLASWGQNSIFDHLPAGSQPTKTHIFVTPSPSLPPPS